MYNFYLWCNILIFIYFFILIEMNYVTSLWGFCYCFNDYFFNIVVLCESIFYSWLLYTFIEINLFYYVDLFLYNKFVISYNFFLWFYQNWILVFKLLLCFFKFYDAFYFILCFQYSFVVFFSIFLNVIIFYSVYKINFFDHTVFNIEFVYLRQKFLGYSF
jgi:hypothetical protein